MNDPIGDGMQAFADAVTVACQYASAVFTAVIGGGMFMLACIVTAPFWLTGLALKFLFPKLGQR